MEGRIKRYNKMYIDKESTFIDKTFYRVRKAFIKEKENITVNTTWRLSGQKSYKTFRNLEAVKEEPNWNALSEKAEVDFKKNSTNKFYMSNEFYQKKIVPRMKIKCNKDTKKSYGTSKEYEDLDLFLEVCKEENLEVMLVLLPVNGYWYDYTGFPQAGREKFVTNVEKIADKYNVKTCNLFGESYTPGFLEDAVHPSGKGWVKINEKIYKFVK